MSEPDLYQQIEAGASERVLECLHGLASLPAGLDGRAAILAALETGSLALIAELLRLGAPVDLSTDQGSLTHEAVDLERADAAEVLDAVLAAGAPLASHGINGWTPLHQAAAWGTVEQMAVLLRRGAPVDARGSLDGGPTPLHEAAHLGRADSAEVLLRNGAEPRLADAFGQTAEKIAREDSIGPVASSPLAPLLKAGLAASAGRALHAELGITGESDHQREVLALLAAAAR